MCEDFKVAYVPVPEGGSISLRSRSAKTHSGFDVGGIRSRTRTERDGILVGYGRGDMYVENLTRRPERN